jgi:probable F420-dependent oxidoreductase
MHRTMRSGIYVRNMGPQSAPATLLACARAAEDAGIDDLWVADHIAIPPDDAEGSGGRYLDPLATLAYLAAATTRIGLGTGVLVLPYRPPLATAKWIATVQELSGGRLNLGVGAGWMEAEFRAVGVAPKRRGAITDATLEFLSRCFAADEVESNGQRMLFLPRPKRPPIFVGGGAPQALRRAARFGDGWMPTGAEPEQLRPVIAELRAAMAAAGKASTEVVLVTRLPLADPARSHARAQAFADVGVTRLVHGWRYADEAEFRRGCEALAGLELGRIRAA